MECVGGLYIVVNNHYNRYSRWFVVCNQVLNEDGGVK